MAICGSDRFVEKDPGEKISKRNRETVKGRSGVKNDKNEAEAEEKRRR